MSQKYIIEIDRKGNFVDWPFCQANFNLILVTFQNKPVIEIGINGVKPNGACHHAIIDKKQYSKVGKFLLLFLHTFTAVQTEKETVFTNRKFKSFPSRRFSIQKQDELMVSDILFLECYKNQKYLKRIDKIVSSISKLRKLKTEKAILQKLELILRPEYPFNVQLMPFHILLIHLLNNQSISKFHSHILHIIFNIFGYSLKEYEHKKALIDSSIKPTENIQLRIVKEYDQYIVFEIFNQ